MTKMPKMTKAILILPNSVPIEVEIPHGLTGLQAAVGGYIEGLPSREDQGWVAYGNEEAKIQGLLLNLVAHGLLVELAGHDAGDVLRGPVVFVGQDSRGEEQDIPEGLMQTLETAAREMIVRMRFMFEEGN